jgi:hypothetical protein
MFNSTPNGIPNLIRPSFLATEGFEKIPNLAGLTDEGVFHAC